MITAAIIGLMFGGIRAVMGLVPTWDSAADPFGSAAFSVGSMVGALDGYAPVAVIGVSLVLLLSLKVGLLGWRLVVFVYHQFWGAD